MLVSSFEPLAARPTRCPVIHAACVQTMSKRISVRYLIESLSLHSGAEHECNVLDS